MKFDITSGVVLLGTVAALGTALMITTIGSPEATRNVEHLFAFVNGRKDVLEIDESTAAETTAAVTSYDSTTTAQSMTTYETTTLTAAPTADLTTTSAQYTVVSATNVEVEVNEKNKRTAKNSLGEELNCDLQFVDKDDLNCQAILYFDHASEIDLTFCYLSNSCAKSSRFDLFLKSGEESDQYQELNSFTLTKDSLPEKLLFTVPEKTFLLINASNTEEYCFGAQYRIGCSIHSAPITSK